MAIIEWHQLREYGHKNHIDVTNLDFVMFAESFGAKGYKVESTEGLQDMLRTAMKSIDQE